MKNKKSLLQENLSTWNYMNFITSYTTNNTKCLASEMLEIFECSATIWVGNLPDIITESGIYVLFGIYGLIKKIILGVNRHTGAPVGFAFVEFYKHDDAVKACIFSSGMKIKQNYLKVDLDAGFEDGREFGRGEQGFTRKQERKFSNNKRVNKYNITNYH